MPETEPFGTSTSRWPRSGEEVADELARLWRTWREHGDTESRNRLLVHYSPLVRFIVSRIGSGLPAHIEFSDLVSTGVFGLLDALEKYQPERGVPFEAYATTRIRGAVLDDLRSQDWLPRTVREQQKVVKIHREEFAAKHGREPSRQELSNLTGFSLSQLEGVMTQEWFAVVESLDESVAGRDDNGTTRSETVIDITATDPAAALTQREHHEHLTEAVELLPAREAKVIRLYYGDTLNMRQIAEVLGVTESRVSQLRSSAIGHLRELMQQREAA